MVAKLHHSIAVQERAVAADSVETFDLPVNPLSVVLVNIRPLNDNAGTPVTGPARYLNLCAAFNRITIAHRGASVMSMRGEDIAVYNYLRHGCVPREANPDDTDNERRSVVLPIFMGRFAFDPHCCFPATRRGELTIEFDIDVADTGYDNFRYNVETVELLGASPKEYERRTAINRTFAATGINDIELPLGNLMRGIFAFGTTGFTGAAPAPSLGRMEVLLDNQQSHYTGNDFETIMTLGALLGRQPPYLDVHTHRVDATAASAVQETGGPIEQGMGGWDLSTYLDFDPTRDDLFSLDTKGASTCFLRVNAETADAVRIVPVERILVRGD